VDMAVGAVEVTVDIMVGAVDMEVVATSYHGQIAAQILHLGATNCFQII